MSNPRKPSPYSSFNSYNKFEVKQKQEENQKIQQHTNVSKNFPVNQANQQMNQQVDQRQVDQLQMNQQVDQRQVDQRQTRFKHIQSSEHMHNVLINGLGQFQNNFASKNIQAPPMRMFIKLYTDWCGPCKKIGPILDEISLNPNTKDIIFMKFDAELMTKGQCHFSTKLREILKVSAVPAMFGFIDGKLVDTVFGADMTEINGLLNKLIQF